ncbi:MAG: EF-P beta-lysylation protein EpmB [Planctomycetaceae bacterium]|nr:EF-P beta-lysylation protein EpmB [Planctomycetaceae bacterium]
MTDCVFRTKRGASPPPPADWQSILAHSVRSPAELCRTLGLPASLAADAEPAADRWSMLVPHTYLARIRPADPADPLLRQVLPRAAELATTAGYTADPLAESHAQCGPGLLQKYRGRILMVTAPHCGVHCRFCFRRHFPFDNASTADWQPAIQTITADPSIHEVILSGGDPLSLSDSALADLADQLAAIPHLRRLRVHTRLPILIPQRVTTGLLRALRKTRLTAVTVVHVNHPGEIDADVADALGRLIDAGIPVLSQSVLLHGVNDSADILTDLYERLIDLRVIPYYLHRLDHVAGAAHFEVASPKAAAIVSELRARLPGYAVPRHVCETPGGTSKELVA